MSELSIAGSIDRLLLLCICFPSAQQEVGVSPNGQLLRPSLNAGAPLF
jgi:hypothetical protein